VSDPLKLAVPSKGRLSERALELLSRAGFHVPRHARRLMSDVNGTWRLLFVRTHDIPEYVATGTADAGITGSDLVAEHGVGVEELLPLGFGRCRLVVAAPRLGAIQAMWVLRLVSLAALLFVFVARGSRDRPAQTAPWWRGAHVGLFDSGGGLFIAWGVQVGTVAVVSTVWRLFTAVTVLLAWVFVKERLAWNQLAGFLLILLGVALISAH